MSIDKVLSSYPQNQATSRSYFLLDANNDFASKLTLGQVIEARVMRHHEGNRYSVSIQGKERIIDSANPLQNGQLIEGRVKSIGKRVEIQQTNTIIDPKNQLSTNHAKLTNLVTDQTNSKTDDIAIRQFFADKQVTLSKQELHTLKEAMKTALPPHAMLLSGLAIKKAGVGLNKESLSSVAKLLIESPYQKNHAHIRDAAVSQIEAKAPLPLVSKDTIEDLSESMRSFAFLGGGKSGNEQSGHHFSQDKGNHWLARWILNTQDDSSMNHRLMTFPVWLGDKLTEIRMALFDQEHKSADFHKLPFKKAVFTVKLDVLGTITVSSLAHGGHISVNISSENSDATLYIASYASELKQLMREMDWHVDSLKYSTEKQSPFDESTHSVVEHYINKDSISRLL